MARDLNLYDVNRSGGSSVNSCSSQNCSNIHEITYVASTGNKLWTLFLIMELNSTCLKDNENDNIWDFLTFTTSYLFNRKIENKHPEKARDLHKSEAEAAKSEQCQRRGKIPKPGYFLATNLCHCVPGQFWYTSKGTADQSFACTDTRRTAVGLSHPVHWRVTQNPGSAQMNTDKEPTLHYIIRMRYYWNTSNGFDSVYAQSDNTYNISRNSDSWMTLLDKKWSKTFTRLLSPMQYDLEGSNISPLHKAVCRDIRRISSCAVNPPTTREWGKCCACKYPLGSIPSEVYRWKRTDRLNFCLLHVS